MKRKIIIILMAIVSVFACLFGLSACGGSDVPEKDKPNSGQEQKPGGDEGKEEPAVTVENVGELKTKYGTQLNDFLKEVVLNASVQCSVSNFSENSLLALQFDIGETTAAELSSVKTVFNYPGTEGDVLYVNEMSFAQPVELNKIAEYGKNKGELLSAAGKASVNQLYAVTYDPALTDSGLASALYGKAVGSTQKATLYLKDNGTTPYPVEGGQRMFICRNFALTAVNDKVTEYIIYVKDSSSIEDMLDESSNYKVARTKEKCELKTLVEYKAAQTVDYKTVKFNANYEGAKPISDKNFEVGKLMTGLPVPTREGYSFICWTDAFGEEYTSATVMPNENLNLKARWEKKVSSYSDEYVSFKPASAGPRDEALRIEWTGQVDEFVYVEITSDDLGGASKVGMDNNFTLRTMESMEYKVNSGYTWAWYQGNFDTPNGAQRFTLRYGNNVQLVTVSDGSGVVRQTYLLNIYVKHDYYINLYKNIFEEKPYDKIRVIEGERFSSETPVFDYENGFKFDSRVYYNENTLAYEKFVYSTAIMKDWNLYQSYKSINVAAELDGGTLDGRLTITPYTPFFALPLPEKEGYDFIGWKNEQGKFITNVQGYSGKKYMACDYDTDKPEKFAVPEKLTAEFAKKKMYYTFEDDVLRTYKTVPVITYTNELMTEILEIIYVPYGENCVLPVKTAHKPNTLFKGWNYYPVNNKDGKFGNTPSDFFEIERKITAPVALFPDLEASAGYAVHLNEKTVYGSSGDYVMYLPANERYTLTISTTGSVKINIHKYGETNNSVTATVTSSSPRTFELDYYVYELGSTVRAHGYVWFEVSSISGTFTAELKGSTANVDYEPIVTDDTNTLDVGEEFTVEANEKPGYTFLGWFKGETKLSDDLTYTFAMPSENVTYKAKYDLWEGLENFDFTYTETTLNITGIKDKTVTEITVPDFVTSINKGAFRGCNRLESITIPFIGGGNDDNSFFAYIFGANKWDYQKNFIPQSLKTVIISDVEGDNQVTKIDSYAFYEFSSLTSITIPDSVTMIGYRAFENCISLKSIIIPNSVISIGSSAFGGCRNLSSITIPFIGGAKGRSSWFGYIFGAGEFDSQKDYVPRSLETVIISEVEDNIAKNAFKDCRYIISITIPDSVTSIGNSAFIDCVSLKNINIPDSVNSIDDNAFSGCSSLTSITIPGSVTRIGGQAFKDCSSLTNVIIGDGVTSIGSSAFVNCDSLTSIIIPDSVTSIGWAAFNVYLVYYKGTQEDWNNISFSDGNESLINATRYYYSEEQPADDGNYWHYVDGEVVVWVKE